MDAHDELALALVAEACLLAEGAAAQGEDGHARLAHLRADLLAMADGCTGRVADDVLLAVELVDDALAWTPAPAALAS